MKRETEESESGVENYVSNIRVMRGGGGASSRLLAVKVEEGSHEPRSTGKPLQAGKGKETDFPPESPGRNTVLATP